MSELYANDSQRETGANINEKHNLPENSLYIKIIEIKLCGIFGFELFFAIQMMQESAIVLRI